ncbi:hypothetical protein L2E82_35099 [Cichorium intybus]|uniref:Uncharacterized protein n=1 Tax=Cichorium intybus TaxID=13427 RepID=A0ACB9BN87_CICIN|nr:hypothetical protein L2E82_35099 [Cichorium intybus]
MTKDYEEEVIDYEEEKKEFVDFEDSIIRMTIEQIGSSDIVLDLLAKHLSRKPCEFKERYEALINRDNVKENDDIILRSFLDKDLESAQDSLDNLFCHRCLIFDCKLHKCSQELIFPVKLYKEFLVTIKFVDIQYQVITLALLLQT